jgi:prephenate dehydratase
MANVIRQVSYAYITTPNKPGEAASVLQALRDGGVNLLASVGFPAGRAKAQIDLVTDDVDALKSVAKKQKWKLSRVKRAFLVEGTDVVGAAVEPLEKLAGSKINIIAIAGSAAGEGRYGMIFWVEQRDYRRAAKLLGAI